MPGSGRIQDADFGLVKVQMPEPVDMADFKAAHLPVLEPLRGPLLTIGGLCRSMALGPAIVAHAAQHGFVAGHRSEMRLLANQGL